MVADLKRKFCKFRREAVFTKGDPEWFDEETREWISVIMNFLAIEWRLKVHPHLTDDMNYYNKYAKPIARAKSSEWGGCDTSTGLTWLNPRKHQTNPRSQLLNTLVHELLHMRFPNASEKDILTLANGLVQIQDD